MQTLKKIWDEYHSHNVLVDILRLNAHFLYLFTIFWLFKRTFDAFIAHIWPFLKKHILHAFKGIL